MQDHDVQSFYTLMTSDFYKLNKFYYPHHWRKIKNVAIIHVYFKKLNFKAFRNKKKTFTLDCIKGVFVSTHVNHLGGRHISLNGSKRFLNSLLNLDCLVYIALGINVIIHIWQYHIRFSFCFIKYCVLYVNVSFIFYAMF